MNTVYNLGMSAAAGLLRHLPYRPKGKFGRFVELQCSTAAVIERLRNPGRKPGGRTVWFHAASLGEYQIARPLMLRLRKEQPATTIVLSFFSSTGIDALAGKSPETTGADLIVPLPLDTRRNARRFLDALAPDEAVFMVSEFWPNYLDELQRRGIPSTLWSALFRPRGALSPGGRFRDAMVKKFSAVVVHDSESEKYLRTLGVRDVRREPDPLWENIRAKVAEPYSNPAVEAFLKQFPEGTPVFIAGSVHTDMDLELAAGLISAAPEAAIIIVPHEVDEATLREVERAVGEKSVRASSVVSTTSEPRARVLIIDTVGELAYLYRYATGAYVGGGFTRLLHSVIEPAAYGLPVAFGPRIERKTSPRLLIEEGRGTLVRTPSDLAEWWRKETDKSATRKLAK